MCHSVLPWLFFYCNLYEIYELLEPTRLTFMSMDPITPTSLLIKKIQEILLAVLVLQVSHSACQLPSQAQVELPASAVTVMIRGTSGSSFKKKIL